MGEEEDPQKIKRISAAAYDYESDPRWAEYWSNVLIPPQMASRSDVVDHFKRKFYQRYIDPELVVDAMSSASSSQSSRASTRSETPASSDQGRASSASQGSNSATRSAPRGTASTASPLQLNRQTIQFAVNAWVFIVALLGIFPFAPRNLSNKACRLALLGTACSSLYSLYTLYGKPRAWNLPSIQTWFQSIIATKDFMYFVYCLVFVPFHMSFKFAMIPLLCRALEHNAKFLRRNFSRSLLYRKYLEAACVWIDANTTTLSILSSNAEVALGFLLIVSLFSWHRNIVQTFMYWQLLKLMYHAPATASYHQSIWASIGRTVSPYIHRHAPFLNTPLAAIQRWWFH